jgi:hypothetical protein
MTGAMLAFVLGSEDRDIPHRRHLSHLGLPGSVMVGFLLFSHTQAEEMGRAKEEGQI